MELKQLELYRVELDSEEVTAIEKTISVLNALRKLADEGYYIDDDGTEELMPEDAIHILKALLNDYIEIRG